MTWQAESLQFALFTAPTGAQPDALQPWLKLFPTGPQNFQGLVPGPQPQSTAAGPLGDFTLTISSTPGRFDLVITMREDNPSPKGPPRIADISVALQVLTKQARKFVEVQPAVRLAFVANLAMPTDDAQGARQLFLDLVPGVQVPNSAIDLAFQVNLQKTHEATGRAMNRLCRWQTQVGQMIMFGMSPSGPSAPTVHVMHSMGLVLDVNTVPSSPANFDMSTAIALVEALAYEVEQIISGGYEYVTNQ